MRSSSSWTSSNRGDVGGDGVVAADVDIVPHDVVEVGQFLHDVIGAGCRRSHFPACTVVQLGETVLGRERRRMSSGYWFRIALK